MSFGYGCEELRRSKEGVQVFQFRLQVAALVSQVLAIALHLYLSVQGFSIKLGFSASSALCKVGEAFDCSSVAASPYSQMLGIPTSVWGFAVNSLLLLLLVLWAFKWVDELYRIGRYCLYLAFSVACVSVVMAGVSLFLVQKFCIFCIGAYILSFTSLACVWMAYVRSVREGQKTKQKSPEGGLCAYWLHDFKVLFTSKRVLFLLATAVVAFMANKSFLSHYEAQDVGSIARAMLREWQVNPEKDFTSTPPLMSKGEAQKPVMQINEFADFLCGHCKRSATPLAAFTASRPGVQFNFYVFPLDGACNDSISRSSGVPCFLAKLTYCAGQQQQAWQMHDLLFDHQENLYTQQGLEAVQAYLQPMIEHRTTLKVADLYKCATSDEAREKIVQQAALGKKIGIQGTPTVFVNNRQLDRGQVIPVLEAVYQHIQKSQP